MPRTPSSSAAWPARCATSPATTTSAGATTAAIRPASTAPAAWEQGLDSHDLAGARVAVAPTLGQATLLPAVQEAVLDAAAAADRWRPASRVVEVPVGLPGLGLEWALANMASLLVALGERYPEAQAELTTELQVGLSVAQPGLQPRDGGHASSAAAPRPTRPWPPSSTGSTS